MSLPPIPKETGDNTRDIHTLFLYLQRYKDGFADQVATVAGPGGPGYTDEQAQDAVGHMVTDTPTVDATYDDVTPQLSWNVVSNSSTQRVEVAKSGVLIGTRKNINFVEAEYQQLDITDDASSDRVNITISNHTSRLVVAGLPVMVKDRQSMIVSRYMDVEGILDLQGDATLEIF